MLQVDLLPERKMGLIVHVSFTVLAGHPASNVAKHHEQVLHERKIGLNHASTSLAKA